MYWCDECGADGTGRCTADGLIDIDGYEVGGHRVHKRSTDWV